MKIAIVGRQSEIAFAELEASVGAQYMKPIGKIASLVDVASIEGDRYGSLIKIAELKETITASTWREVESHVADSFKELSGDGKHKIGVSVYGLNASPREVERTLLNTKKQMVKKGASVRVVNHGDTILNSAQARKNKLTTEGNREVLVVHDGSQVHIAHTEWIQDINAYARRDQERPARDARVGMLPPKLAQILINMAIGEKKSPQRILDPFCGTGVILQEALLSGHKAMGSDVDARMVEYSEANMQWLEEHYELNGTVTILKGDAKKVTWPLKIDAVATETYLGDPLTSVPSPPKLQELRRESADLLSITLQNIGAQIEPKTRVVLAIPAWKTSNGSFAHSPVVDQIEELGYNLLSFEHADAKNLIYHRPDQIVGRHILIMERS